MVPAGGIIMDIAQAVAAYNQQREGFAATRSAAYGKQNYIMAALAVVLVTVVFGLYRGGNSTAAIVAGFVGVFGLCICFAVLRGKADEPGIMLQTTMREKVFPALFSDIKDARFLAKTKGFYNEIPDGIRRTGTKYEWGDLIEGSYKGHPIEINEVTVFKKTKSGSETKTVQDFKGIALRTGLENAVPDLIVTKGRMAVARWISEKLGTRGDTPHVAFDDAAFEAAFDVHCGDEGFARSVFSDAGRARLMTLQARHTKGALRLAATGTQAYILLDHAKDFFELPPLDRPFNEATDGRALHSEMQGFLELIDAVRDMLESGANEQLRL